MNNNKHISTPERKGITSLKSSGGMLAIIIFFSVGISLFVKPILHERKNNKTKTVNTLKQKWGGQQILSGPTLIIPYLTKDITEEDVVENGTYTRKKKEIIHQHEAFFLPKKLDIDAIVNTETRYISIYEVPIYEAQVEISSTFEPVTSKNFEPKNIIIQWEKAYFAFQVKDIHGISKISKLQTFNKNLNIKIKELNSEKSILYTEIENINSESFKNDFSLNYSIDLKGTEEVFFTAGAKNTTVNLNSNWPHPGFQGDFFPTQRKINPQGFQAKWEIPSLSSGLQLSWTGYYRGFSNSTSNQTSYYPKNSFGVHLVKPVDIYQKNTRTTKYAVLVIILTFASFFIISILSKLRLHPMHYFFVGCSIVMFYILLISFSEHIGFSYGYLLASTSVITLVSLYGRSLFQSKQKSLSIACILSSLFGFLFIVFKNQDYALLIGSIGMFITLALVMYVSRNINWSKLEIEEK